MVSEKEKSRSRASILIVGVLFATAFVLINAQEFLLSAFIYIVIAVMSLVLYKQWSGFGRSGNLVGIDKNFFQDFFVGAGLGVGTIILSNFIPTIGALGIPNVQSISGTIGRFVIIAISAPVFEEIFFRDFMLDFFDEKFRDMPFIVANVIVAVLFALYHLVAYGESLSDASGSFFTAGLMGFIFGIVRLKQNSVAGAIAFHATLNIYLGFVSLAVIVG